MARNLYKTQLLSAASALDAAGTIGPNELSGAESVSIYVVFGPGTASGVVSIEGSHSTTYTGIWANLATVTWAAADRVHNVAIVGNHIALRARISTVIAGGVVDVFAQVAG